MRVRPDGLELVEAAGIALDAAVAPYLADDRRDTIHVIEEALALAGDRLARDAEPSAADLALLERARVTMRGEVLEALPERCRYDARMIAKAISVATLQLVNGHASERREYQRLCALLGVPAADATPHGTRCALVSLNERLASRIRAGEADVGTTMHDATLAHLEAITNEALSESSPTYRRRVSAPADSRSTVRADESPPRGSPAAASLAAWSDVPRAFLRALPSAASPRPVEQRILAYLNLSGVVGEAVYASSNAVLATQAGILGCFAQRLAANPRVPMLAVESAHLTHDLSLAFADASAAFFSFALGPFRQVASRRADRARLP